MRITVFYDGACPLCTKEVAKWRKAPFTCPVEWFDINGQEDALIRQGIDPHAALVELHTKTKDGVIRTSIDSYVLLLSQLPRWRWVGSLMNLPIIKPTLKWIYDVLTKVRLKKEGRWNSACDSKRCR